MRAKLIVMKAAGFQKVALAILVIRTTKATFKTPKPKEFAKDILTAKESHPPEDQWRVSSLGESDYTNCKLYTTDGGSTVAVEPDGNIISVCRHNSDPNAYGSDLVKKAVAEGGDRLDAFGPTLYNFYTRNGFEPVSYVNFNERYAPSDWVKGRDEKEPVVFYKYIGKKGNMSYAKFLSSVDPSSDYETAKMNRDKEVIK
jgi:hypothetical protein